VLSRFPKFFLCLGPAGRAKGLAVAWELFFRGTPPGNRRRCFAVIGGPSVVARRLLKPVRPVIYMQMREPNSVFVRGPKLGDRMERGEEVEGRPGPCAPPLPLNCPGIRARADVQWRSTRKNLARFLRASGSRARTNARSRFFRQRRSYPRFLRRLTGARFLALDCRETQA